jgi:hypothetical protein
MLISNEFDRAMTLTRKEMENRCNITADRLNRRIQNFLDDVNKNNTLNKEAKERIKNRIIKNI